jgi:general stress protein 26
MKQPIITRPVFPEGYVDHPKAQLSWGHVEMRLAQAKNYWLCTVRPNGHPHAVPKWGVWVDGKIYVDGSLETRHARNIQENPNVSVHLESGDDVIIVEGHAQALDQPSQNTTEEVAKAYREKYAASGYAPQADQWDNGGLFEITPHMVLAWTSFTEDPTKFVLE